MTIDPMRLHTHDLISMAQCSSIVNRQEDVIVVPNTHKSTSDPQYAAFATKNITKLWYTASSITIQKVDHL